MARPERIRLNVFDDPSDGVPLDLASRRLWPAALVFGALFVGFAWIAVHQIDMVRGSSVETVFDLSFVLFEGFWILAWSAGVGVLFLGTVLLLLYDESARITASRLLHVPRLGPLRFLIEYDLARIESPRLDESGGPDRVRIRFDYAGGTVSLGNDMPAASGRRVLRTIRDAMDGGEAGAGSGGRSGAWEGRGEDRRAVGIDLTRWLPRRAEPESPGPEAAGPARSAEAPGWTSASVLALLVANGVPLLGVLTLGWDLGAVMVLFWAESAVIGFFSLLRFVFVAGWSALFLGPFFLGHFGGFMAAHFMFIYYLFVRGTGAEGPEPPPLETLEALFVPLWPALAALFVSHGVSFVTNFLGRREFQGIAAAEQMTIPYKRVALMHVTLILGGWIVMVLGSPLGALVLLLVLKTAVDLRAHRKEHGAAREG